MGGVKLARSLINAHRVSHLANVCDNKEEARPLGEGLEKGFVIPCAGRITLGRNKKLHPAREHPEVVGKKREENCL